MADDITARLGLPLIAPGQAQKELTHNEALALVDLAVQASVEAIGLDRPPVAPADGACWIVGTAPVDDWAGHAQALAGWTGGGWRFVPARAGMGVWSVADGTTARFGDDGWTIGTLPARQVVVDGVRVLGAQGKAVADPGGGTVVDDAARTAIAAILTALRTHGLIAT